MKKFFLFAIIISIFALIALPTFAETPIEKTVGDETVEFVIPDDYDTAVLYYKAVIDAYVLSENSNLKKDKIITEYVNATNDLKFEIDNLKTKLFVYEQNVDTYIDESNKFKLYFGVGGLFDISLLGYKQVSLFPQLNFVKPDFEFGILFPVSLNFGGTVQNYFDVSFGIGGTFLKRLKF